MTPAPIPFMEMTRRGSFAESRCPKLLSIAQKTHVSRMPSAERDSPRLPVGSQVRRMHAVVINPSAIQTRRLTHSRKIVAAISVVATASKFRRSAAVAARSREAEYQGYRSEESTKDHYPDKPGEIALSRRRLNVTSPGTHRCPDDGEEQGTRTAPERDQRRERERPGLAEEEFGERGAPADEDRRYERTEDGYLVVRQGRRTMVYLGRFVWIQRKGLQIG